MGKRNKKHWAVSTDDPTAGRKFRLACGRWAWINSAKESGPLWSLCGASVFRDLSACDPDWHCFDCAKAARLALAAESAPKPTSRCATSGCGSYAINPGQSGRDHSDLNLCDVCYWRKRAPATWPNPRPAQQFADPDECNGRSDSDRYTELRKLVEAVQIDSKLGTARSALDALLDWRHR